MKTAGHAYGNRVKRYGLNPKDRRTLKRRYGLLKILEDHNEPLYQTHWAMEALLKGCYKPWRPLARMSICDWATRQGNKMIKIGLAKRSLYKIPLGHRVRSRYIKYEITPAGRNWLRSYEESELDNEL